MGVESVVFGGACRSVAAWSSVLVLGLTAGCASISPSDPAPTPKEPGSSESSSDPSSTSPAEMAGQQAVAAYLGMWKDMAAAARTSNWRDPQLGSHAVGTALTNITRGLYADQANGLVTKGKPKNKPRVTSVEPPSNPAKVVITDCGNDSQWRHYRADNGQLANTGPGGRRNINAVVEKQRDGKWKVTDFGIHEVGSC